MLRYGNERRRVSPVRYYNRKFKDQNFNGAPPPPRTVITITITMMAIIIHNNHNTIICVAHVTTTMANDDEDDDEDDDECRRGRETNGKMAVTSGVRTGII